jgi:hypothetical protein
VRIEWAGVRCPVPPFPVRFRGSESDAFYVRFRSGTFGCVRDAGFGGDDR